MSSLKIGRLALGPALQWYEQTGDPVQTNGGAVVPNTRTAPQYQLVIGTIAPDGQTDTPTARLVLRRQLRSMLNNSPMKLQGFLYIVYSDDPDQDGWYIPDQGNLQDYSGSSGLATGFWQLSSNWYLVGHQRTHREARSIWMKNLTTGQYARDTLGWIYSTAFNGQAPLAWTGFPNGATAALDNVTGQAIPLTALSAGSDGGVPEFATGLSDLQTISYERSESALNLGDVIAYDRNGDTTAPSTGVQSDWNEVYGPDWPWANQSTDVPMLQNGVCRVRYDSGNQPGFRIDAWSSGAWVEQGKITLGRTDDSSGGAGATVINTLVSSGLVEWTPDRAVVQVVMQSSTDTLSHERAFITLQRGWTAPRIEMYLAPGTDGTMNAVSGQLQYTVATTDTNDSVQFYTGSYINYSSAANSGLIPSSTAETPTQNWVCILRQAVSLAVVLAVIQSVTANGGNSTAAYGAARNQALIAGGTGGYISAQVGFSDISTAQVQEAETCTLDGTSSVVTDATASNGEAVKETQTAATAVTILPVSASVPTGTYEIFVRVKVDSGATGSFKTTGGTAVTSTATSWTWIALGTVAGANATAFKVTAWRSAGSGSVYIDRLEAVKIADPRQYDGALDQGNRVLYDSRTLGALVAR